MQQPFFTFTEKIKNYAAEAEKKCEQAFAEIDEIRQYNTAKVLAAFRNNRVSDVHFAPSTGYGYGDRGREVLDAVCAEIFGAEHSLIRHNFMSGTHAISTALFGLLRPGDIVSCVTGQPYDTLHSVIGLNGKGNGQGNLADYGIQYRQVDLTDTGKVDLPACAAAAKESKLIYIQRSRGYTLRPSLSCGEIGDIVQVVKKANPNVLVMVDNCYGEFVECKEPTQYGADIIVGSLIKNPGGGIAKTGGYIAGKKELIELCGYRLSAPGVGSEIGCSLGENRNMFMGLFFAPNVTADALKTAVFAAALFESLGFQALPQYNQKRADIIQALALGGPEELIAFCQGIQAGSPIDAFVTPEPWDMPGYDNQVIMAAGAFTMGASIELSADAPMREPYAVWLQGGLTYASAKIGILLAAQFMDERGLLK